MERLDFHNPVFKTGLNFTVRHGEKWKNRLSIGDTVELGKTGGPAVGTAVVGYIISAPIVMLPDLVFANEHDSGCRTYEDLLEVMAGLAKQHYPDVYEDGFEEFDTVTAIGLEDVAIL